ncbi:MAG: hypothetical protein QW470_02050 [Candidatus Caldarchaeum sp.]
MSLIGSVYKVFEAALKRITALSMLFLCLAAIASASSQASFSRHIHVADGGLVFVTDVIPVVSGSEQLRLGFPADMSKNLAGYMLAGQDGTINVRETESGILWLEAKPSGGWMGNEVAVVTVWRDVLVEISSGRYQLVIPSNPVLEKNIDIISVKLTIDGTASITSATGIEVSSDKRVASGEVTDISPRQFKTITVFFEAPDLLRYVVERAEVEVDLTSDTVAASILVRNVGTTPFNSAEFYLGKEADVMSVTSGLLTLSRSWDAGKGVLTVNFPDSLEAGERITVNIIYKDKTMVQHKNGESVIKLPRLLNTTVAEYFLTLKTPPAESLSYGLEPWSLKLVENNRREVTFRFAGIYVTGRETVTLNFTALQVFPAPALLLLAIAVVASVQIIAFRERRGRRETPADLTNLRRAVEKFVDTALEELDSLKAVEKPAKPPKPVEDQIRSVREMISQARKGIKAGEVTAGLNTLDKLVTELYTTVQAVSKTVEDFRAGRLPRSVFQRVFDEYRKACGKSAGEIYNVLDRISRQT